MPIWPGGMQLMTRGNNAPLGLAGGASYTADPALQLVLSSVNQDIATARAQADERRKKLLLDYGDPALAKTFYGGPSESAYLETVKQNPYGLQQRMARNQKETVSQANEALNQQNLWYGGFRAKTLSDLASAYGEQQYDASSSTQNALMEISDFLLGSEADARNRRIAAEIEAYSRALQGVVGG